MLFLYLVLPKGREVYNTHPSASRRFCFPPLTFKVLNRYSPIRLHLRGMTAQHQAQWHGGVVFHYSQRHNEPISTRSHWKFSLYRPWIACLRTRGALYHNCTLVVFIRCCTYRPCLFKVLRFVYLCLSLLLNVWDLPLDCVCAWESVR